MMPGTQSEPPKRKGKSSLHLELPDSVAERPSVAALFVVHFDVKAGYTISWKRTVDGLDLSNSVEFKSLPSGLHNVEEDLVYFVHEDQHAGISAFVNNSGSKHERGALMLAVGALIPFGHGRLGRSWRHADMLKQLARQLVKDPEQTKPLEEYWEEHKVAGKDAATSQAAGSKPTKETDDPRRPSLEKSAQAQAKSLMQGPTHELSLFHPARSMPAMLETFGPLIYPLYKAALLRKRILLVIEAPVELTCNFVYNVSILSNIPLALANIVPLDPLPVRLQPLFSIGVQDIDDLLARSKQDVKKPARQLIEGWVACTTDNVLCQKKDLYDLRINLPPVRDSRIATKAWPTMSTPEGVDVKANQRDVRRYRNLRKGVERRETITTPVATRDDDVGTDAEDEPLLRPQSRQSKAQSIPDDVEIDEKLVEPVTWSALAYSSFLWWASAGEKGAELDEETDRDQAMFQAFEPYTDTPGRPSSLRSSGVVMTDGSPSAPEMSIIAYFHRMTTTIFEHLSNLVDDSEEDEDAERRSISGNTDESPVVVVEGEDLVHMGLDPWNESDRVFVEQLLDFYWGRKADVRGGRIECCGVRIC